MILQDLTPLRTLALIAGSGLFITSFSTFENQHRSVQKTLKYTWVLFHRARKRMEEKYTNMFCYMYLMAERALSWLKHDKINTISFFYTIAVLFVFSGISFATQLYQAGVPRNISGLLSAMRLPIIVSILYGYLFICLPRTRIPATMVVWAIAIWYYPYFFNRESDGIVWTGLVIFSFASLLAVVLLRAVLWCGVIMVRWPWLTGAKFIVSLSAFLFVISFKLYTPSDPCNGLYCLYNRLPFDHQFIHLYSVVLIAIPLLMLLIFESFCNLIGGLFFFSFFLATVIRNMFEYQIIKRKRLLLSLAVLFWAYALPGIINYKSVKELILDLIAAK